MYNLVCVYIITCVHEQTYVHVCEEKKSSVYVENECMYLLLCVCVYMCACACVCTCVCVCVCVCV